MKAESCDAAPRKAGGAEAAPNMEPNLRRALERFYMFPKGPKDPNMGYLSMYGIVMMVLGRYLLFGYLDP